VVGFHDGDDIGILALLKISDHGRDLLEAGIQWLRLTPRNHLGSRCESQFGIPVVVPHCRRLWLIGCPPPRSPESRARYDFLKDREATLTVGGAVHRESARWRMCPLATAVLIRNAVVWAMDLRRQSPERQVSGVKQKQRHVEVGKRS